ncbi:MAG: hypothetical protein ACE5OR_11680 [bacterium]
MNANPEAEPLSGMELPLFMTMPSRNLSKTTWQVGTLLIHLSGESISKEVAVGIILHEGGDVAFLERWFSEETDLGDP